MVSVQFMLLYLYTFVSATQHSCQNSETILHPLMLVYISWLWKYVASCVMPKLLGYSRVVHETFPLQQGPVGQTVNDVCECLVLAWATLCGIVGLVGTPQIQLTGTGKGTL